MMRLKRHLSRRNKVNPDNDFYRWDITINPDLIAALEWKNGDELEARKVGKELRIKKNQR